MNALRSWAIGVFAIVLLGYGVGHAQAPPLPPGLGASPAAPVLPPRLGEAPSPAEPLFAWPRQIDGFLETRWGGRLWADPDEKALSIGEVRLQLSWEQAWERLALAFTSDWLYDAISDRRHAVHLETGAGWFDLREAYVLAHLTAHIDIKLGRQITTWGTGDLIFINDLFPKDFKSFFSGRDDAYLKAPSDALKVSWFSPVLNLDVVYTPRFDADRFLDGQRLSFFNPRLGRRTGRRDVLRVNRPSTAFRDDEVAWRLYQTVQGYELALYGYHGFWKSPAGAEPTSDVSTFPALAVYGASLRGALGGGIAHLEVGYYDSLDDRRGDNPLVRNSEFRLLVGYERDAAPNLTLGVQYALEHTLQHRARQPPCRPDRWQRHKIVTC